MDAAALGGRRDRCAAASLTVSLRLALHDPSQSLCFRVCWQRIRQVAVM